MNSVSDSSLFITVDNDANLKVTTINASRDMVIVNDISGSSQPTGKILTKDLVIPSITSDDIKEEK